MSFLSTKILNLNLFTSPSYKLTALCTSINAVQVRNYAARKGTRERKKKAKVKVEVQKVGFIPHNMRDREKKLAERPSRIVDDSWKRDPVDDVYPVRYYKWKVYSFSEAVQAHRETHHPEMYNKPNANLYVTIELNMQGEKKTRFVENFKRMANISYTYDHGEERSVLAFTKNPEIQEKATQAGATLAGGVELIKRIQAGQIALTDFQYVIAHPDILPELVVLRGVLKKRFPNAKLGTLDVDLEAVVHRFLHGISYQAIKDEYEKEFGQIEAILGTLNMDEKHLEDNFKSLLLDVMEQKPKRQGSFIRRCLLWSPPSRENFKVDHELYISEQTSKSESKAVQAEAVAL